MKIICGGFIDIFFFKLFLLVRESIKEAYKHETSTINSF